MTAGHLLWIALTLRTTFVLRYRATLRTMRSGLSTASGWRECLTDRAKSMNDEEFYFEIWFQLYRRKKFERKYPKETMPDGWDMGWRDSMLEGWLARADLHVVTSKHISRQDSLESELCDDCPPIGYPTDKTRCIPCPRRFISACCHDPMNAKCTLEHQFTKGRVRCRVCGETLYLPLTKAQ